MTTPPEPGRQPEQSAPGDQHEEHGPTAGEHPVQPGQPGQYGEQFGGSGQYHPYGQYGQYPYNPYGAQYPASAGLGGEEPGPARRPGVMILALVLHLLSALPFVAAGAVMLLTPIDPQMFPPELERLLADEGITMEQFLSVVRLSGAVMLALALGYDLLAVLAFLGRNAARIGIAVLTVLFGVFLLLNLTSSLTVPAAAVLLMVILVASVTGTVLLFSPASSAYFADRRR